MKRTIESLTPPENKQAMWLDISGKIKQLKAYINGEWVVVNDDTENNEEIVKKVLEKIDKDFESYIKKEDADNTYATKTALDEKVDVVPGKGLSTEDFTSDEKAKLKGIAEDATKVIVDEHLSETSTNAIQNSAVTKAIESKVNKVMFFEDEIAGVVPSPNYDEIGDPNIFVLNANGDWIETYDVSDQEKKTFLAAPVKQMGRAVFRAITVEDLPNDINILDLMSYGISWKPNVADPVVTRVGNMSYHKTLPIQNNMRGCIAQMKNGAKIMYFLDPTDWRWRENPRGSMLKKQQISKVQDLRYKITNTIFSTLQYENQWLKINDTPCQVLAIDTSTNTATVKLDYPIDAGTYDIELGAVLNGYDGEVMVLVPEFWIKSWDTATQREVRISPSKIDDTWEHQPRILIGAYHDTVLNTIPENMGYLSTLEANSALSIANTHDYCRGGNNDTTYDQYITSDRFRSLLGKPRTNVSRATMRANCRRSGKEILSYLQYKRVLYWLYFIEYANFNCQAEFNSELTSEGFRQGGLGKGVTAISSSYWNYYNRYNPLTPNGYTNEFGNRTNCKEMSIMVPEVDGGEPITRDFESVPRWHGIENPFGDTWNNVDGVIINSSSIVENDKKYSEVYATDDPLLYSDSDHSKMRVVGIELNEGGYVREWDLGNTAEIIPRLNGANATQYKCDHHLINDTSELRTLLLGAHADRGSSGGLGCFASNNNVGATYVTIGYRSSCVVA
mgnify:CR=1 FL=1